MTTKIERFMWQILDKIQLATKTINKLSHRLVKLVHQNPNVIAGFGTVLKMSPESKSLKPLSSFLGATS